MTTTRFAIRPFAPHPTPTSLRMRPGTVVSLCGIIFQCDAKSLLGDIFIRPAEALDLWFAGLGRHRGSANARSKIDRCSLGMHAALHVVLEDGSHFVVEQLAGGWREWLVNGLHWTPLAAFQARERQDAGGWDVTIPAHEFRQLDEFAVEFAITRLNSIKGRSFLSEDCTGFIGRVFGPQRRIFADSPILRSLGFDMRSGEPALPLLRREAVLEPKAEERLHGNVLRELPDPAAESGSLSLRQLHHRLLITGAVCAVIAMIAAPAVVRRERKRIAWFRQGLR